MYRISSIGEIIVKDDGNGINIDNILIDNPKANIFVFRRGNYLLTRNLKIDRKNITFIGSNSDKVHIFQTNTAQDGFDIESDGFKMINISVHVEHDDKVALVFAKCSNTIISNCYIYGNATTFSIFYAGPEIKAGQETLDTYFNNKLDKNNVFINNVVYSQWSGDSVSFSLQKNSTFENNIIRGGKVAIYMCNNISFKKNTIYDSTSEGVFISLPSHNIDMQNNRIYECKNSGIKISNQLEHGDFNISPYDITIKKNFISDPGTTAIEINDVIKIKICDNKLIGSNHNGIYVLRSSDVQMCKNKISYFTTAIFVYDSNNNSIKKNKIFSIYPLVAKYFVELVNSKNNIIINNIFKGNFINNIIKFDASDNNVIENNVYDKYYTRNEEKLVMR